MLLAGHVLVIGAYAFLCWQALVVADIVAIERSPALGLPKTYGYWAIAAGCVLLALSTAHGRHPARRHRPRGNAPAQPGGDADMSLVLILAFVALMVAVVPVAHALVIASGVALLWDGQLPLLLVVQQMFQQTQSFPMLALPFFILAGTLIMEGRLGEELLRFSGELMQRVRGGALSTTVVGSVVFGGVSGSAVANASALGSVLIPWQKRQGYPAGLCAANNATSAVIDILIPPSIPMILYAVVSGVSIGDLFMAGVLPGLLMALGLRRRLLVERPAASICRRRRRRSTCARSPAWRCWRSPALILPVLILVALRFGFATPTEIAVMAVLYALVASLFLYRDMSWRRFHKAMIDAGIATGIVMMVIMGSAAASWILTYDQVPQRFAEWVSTTLREPWLVILAMNVIMLVIGGPLDLAPGDPAAGAHLRPAGAADRARPAAARPDDGAQPRHRPLHAAGRNDAVHLVHHRRQHHGRDDARRCGRTSS